MVLPALRKLSKKHDALLISMKFTPGSVAPGNGLPATYGNRADLVCLGKAFVGGFQSACVGRAELRRGVAIHRGEAIQPATFGATRSVAPWRWPKSRR